VPLPDIEEHRTEYVYRIQGEAIAVADPLGRVAVRRVYDLLQHPLRIDSVDAGSRVRVFDAAGNLTEERDAKGALELRAFDQLHRPVRMWARDAAAQPVTLRERMEYGGRLTPG